MGKIFVLRRFHILFLAMVVFAGCRKEEISVYRIPKESSVMMPSSAANSAADAAPVTVPIKYQLPKGWVEAAPDGKSVANFTMASGKAGLSIMSFAGDVSSLIIINIIRNSVHLPPLSDEEAAKLVEPVAVGGEKGSFFDLTTATQATNNSAPDKSIVVTVLARGGATWFFKMVGAPEVLKSEKPAFLEFLKSVTFLSEGAPIPVPQMPVVSANSGQMPPDMVPPPPAVDKPAWEVPASWHEVPPTQMLLAKFTMGEGDGSAAVTVSSFPGDVGGLLLNINRWRKSVGLPDVTADTMDKSFSYLDVLGGRAMLVDATGKSNGKDTRLIGVIWPRGGQTWFYKMMGDATVTGQQKDAFLKFIQSVHYPNG